jgi:uncharacterized cupin superfamily protein
MNHLVHWNDAERVRREIGEIATFVTDLGTAAGSEHIGLRRWEVDAGRRSAPPHAHPAEEEILFVLAGSGLLWQDGQVCEVGAGDCIVHPADHGAHALRAGPDGLDVLAFGTRIRGRPDIFELDADTGPLRFAPPGPRPANVVNLDAVSAVEGGEGDCGGIGRDIGRALGSVSTGMRHRTAHPGHLSGPPHCHGAEEELFVVLDGSGWVLLGDEEAPVRRGHILSRPAGTGVAHALRGGPDGITFLAYGTREPNDICYYPRSNKIYWCGVDVIGRIERLEYWDGERDFPPRA